MFERLRDGRRGVPNAETRGNAGVLDCSWAEGDNCWKAAIAAAAGCLPPSADEGTLSADEKTCTYATGTTVDFTDPLLIGPAETLSNFTVSTGGMPCLVFTQIANGFAVKTPAGEVSVVLDSTRSTLILTCADGAAFAGQYAAVMACQYALPLNDLGEGFSGTDGGYAGHSAFSLSGTAEPDGGTGEIGVFDCATP